MDTLRAIHASHPHAGLTFIVGADTASTLPSWREPRELLELASLAVAARSGWDRAAVLEALSEVDARDPQPEAAKAHSVRFLEMAEIEVSSSMVRARAAEGGPIEELVGAAVAGYILEHGLYGTGAPAVVPGGGAR